MAGMKDRHYHKIMQEEIMRKAVLLLSAAMLVVMMSGCDGSDDATSSTTDPAAAAQRVQQANDIFYPRMALLINSGGGGDTSAFNFSSANALYREALALDPSNTQAHFGVAVTGFMGLLGNPAFQKLPASSNLIFPAGKARVGERGTSSRVPAELLRFGESTRDRIIGIARSALRPPYRGIAPGSFLSDATDYPPSYYQALIEANILPVLNDAVSHLVTASLDPDFAFYVTPQQLGGNISDSIRIDLTEVNILLAVCEMLVGDCSMAVAYDIDYDSQSESAVVAAWDVNSPFLALRSGGAQHMHTAKISFVGATNVIQNAIVYLSNETPHPGVDLIPYNPADYQTLIQVYAVMDSLEMLLTGPYQMTGDFNNDNSPDVLTVNLYNFFENAVPNYKQKLPAYTVSAVPGEGTVYDALLTWDATSYNTWNFPDPTFNGLFPDMTNPILKAMLGIDPLGWTRYVLIEG